MSDVIEVIIRAKDETGKGIGSVKSGLSGLSSALGPLKTIGTAAFLGVGAAAVGGFGLAMGAAINMNASLEQSTMQFTTLMGDADLAAEHVANLFEFGAKTPFETGPIITASKHFQVFGGAALNTMENLTLVGDAAAAVGAPIDEVSFWVGRLYSNLQAGQPFGEAAMRLQELGIMTPQVRAEMEAMQAAGANGTVIFGEFQGAIGSFTGAMEMQSQSWAGLTSTIRDQLGMLAAETLRPFFDLLKTGLASLSQWLASPEVQAGLQQLAAGFAEVITKIAAFVTNQVVPFVQQHGPLLMDIILGVGTALGALTIIGTVVGWISAFTAAWVAAGTTVGGTFSVMSAIVGILGGPVTIVIAAVAAAIGLLTVAWRNNWGDIQGKTEAVVNFLRGLIEAFLANVRAWWDAHGEGIVAAAKQAWELIQGLIDGVIKHIQLIVEAFQLAFQGDWEGFGQKIFEIWENAWMTVVNFLAGLWGMVLPWLQSLWNSIRKWFTSTDWASLGRNIIQGIINGLRAMGGALTGVLEGIVNAAINRIKQLLGIASPSRLFFEIGVNMAQGLIDGIRSMEGEAVNVMEELFDAMSDVQGVAGGFESLFEAQFVTPLEGGIAALDGQIGTFTDSIEEMIDGLGLDLNDPNLRLQLMQIMGSTGFSADQRNAAATALAFLDQRQQLMLEQLELQRELEQQQARLMQLELQRQQIGFLQQQFDLLKLIQDNGLDTALLDGLTLGLDADPAALLSVMQAALQTMLATTAAELGGVTPPATRGGLADEFFGGARGGGVVVNIDARRAERGVDRDLRAMVEQVMREYGTRADIRVRTG